MRPIVRTEPCLCALPNGNPGFETVMQGARVPWRLEMRDSCVSRCMLRVSRVAYLNLNVPMLPLPRSLLCTHPGSPLFPERLAQAIHSKYRAATARHPASAYLCFEAHCCAFCLPLGSGICI